MKAIRDLWDSSSGVRFVAVGGACALLYFGIFLFFTDIARLTPFFASLGAYFTCFWVGYMSQRKIAFRSTASHSVTLSRYFIWHAFGATTVSAATSAVAQSWNLAAVYTALVSTILCGIVSFFISSRWVFRNA